MTQLEENDEYKLLYEYGIIQFDYHFSDAETVVDISTYGNAGQYFDNTQNVQNSSDMNESLNKYLYYML